MHDPTMNDEKYRWWIRTVDKCDKCAPFFDELGNPTDKQCEEHTYEIWMYGGDPKGYLKSLPPQEWLNKIGIEYIHLDDTLEIYKDGDYVYDISLKRSKTREEQFDWIIQVSEKSWMKDISVFIREYSKFLQEKGVK